MFMKSTLTTLLKMRAIRVHKFGDVGEMKLEENVPVPSVSDNQILIKLHSSGVNPVDTYIRSGQYASVPTLPYIPGKDGAGVVHSTGCHVTKFNPGDRVFCSQSLPSGTLAEFVAMEESHVFPLADRLSFHQGAAIPIPYFTAYHALMQKAKAQKGDHILVHGASGAVGVACVQMAKAFGMSVVGTAGTPEGLSLVKSAGADAAYNHRDKKYLTQMANENKFNVILEMLANVNLGHDLNLMQRGGRIVVIGSRGSVQIDPRSMMFPETSVIGCALLSSTMMEWNEITASVMQGIDEGWVTPVIQRVYELEQASQAHHDIIHNKGTQGKLVVCICE